MRLQSTKIEELDRKHTGLRLMVDLALDGGQTLEEIQASVKSRVHVTVPVTTLSNYKQRRWLPAKLRIKELQETFRAIKDELGENAIGESTQAKILELLDHAMRAGGKFDPNLLLTEQRKWAEVELKRSQLEQQKRALELKVEQFKGTKDKLKAAVEKSAEAGGVNAKDELLKRIDEIYGTYQEAASAPLPGEVGG